MQYILLHSARDGAIGPFMREQKAVDAGQKISEERPEELSSYEVHPLRTMSESAKAAKSTRAFGGTPGTKVDPSTVTQILNSKADSTPREDTDQ